MRPQRDLIELEDALALCSSRIAPVEGTEQVRLADALGRVLAEDLMAGIDIPPFDRSSMDGYAVRSVDTKGAGRANTVALRLADRVDADQSSKIKMGPGECVQIATGAEVPKGADAVVMIEDTSAGKERVKISKSVAKGENISRRGSDIARGSHVLSSGQTLGIGAIGAVASLGLARINVFAKPLVAVISTGNKVAGPGAELVHGQVYDANSYLISGVLSSNGCAPIAPRRSPDTLEDLSEALETALESDMIVFSGGSSAGEKDLLRDVIAEQGEVLFHGIRIKPGKPTMFGMVDDKPVFGMPGLPAACLMSSHVILAPCARLLARLPPRQERIEMLTVGSDLSNPSGRPMMLPVRTEGGSVFPAFKESGAMSSAEGYIWIVEAELGRGSIVEVRFF